MINRFRFASYLNQTPITLTSWWARWRLKSPASPLFNQPIIQAQITESIKAPRHWSLGGEFTGDRWIPRTNGNIRGKCFHLMTSSCDSLVQASRISVTSELKIGAYSVYNVRLSPHAASWIRIFYASHAGYFLLHKWKQINQNQNNGASMKDGSI